MRERVELAELLHDGRFDHDLLVFVQTFRDVPLEDYFGLGRAVLVRDSTPLEI